MDGWKDGWMDGWIGGWVGGQREIYNVLILMQANSQKAAEVIHLG